MSSKQEEEIQKALNDLQENKFNSIKQAADYYNVLSSTLAHRVRGRRSKANIKRKSQRFTNEEEKVLVQWIKDLQRQRISLNYATIRLILQNLL
jgi:helix-turn-helix, Psq domain